MYGSASEIRACGSWACYKTHFILSFGEFHLQIQKWRKSCTFDIKSTSLSVSNVEKSFFIQHPTKHRKRFRSSFDHIKIILSGVFDVTGKFHLKVLLALDDKHSPSNPCCFNESCIESGYFCRCSKKTCSVKHRVMKVNLVVKHCSIPYHANLHQIHTHKHTLTIYNVDIFMAMICIRVFDSISISNLHVYCVYTHEYSWVTHVLVFIFVLGVKKRNEISTLTSCFYNIENTEY